MFSKVPVTFKVGSCESDHINRETLNSAAVYSYLFDVCCLDKTKRTKCLPLSSKTINNHLVLPPDKSVHDSCLIMFKNAQFICYTNTLTHKLPDNPIRNRFFANRLSKSRHFAPATFSGNGRSKITFNAKNGLQS